VVSPGDILDSDSGAVAFVVRQQLRNFAEGKSGQIVYARPVVKTDYWSIIVGIALGAATLVQIAL
jgi:hypothetical protein